MSSHSLYFYEIDPAIESSLDEILLGLSEAQKMIPSKYFYDERGSELFMEITRQPEYYLTRTENALLQRYAHEITAQIEEDCLLIEYGSGSSEKTRILLESLRPRAYAPLDISKDYLVAEAGALTIEFPWLEVHATCLDFTADFELPFSVDAKHVAFFPGSSIGNFNRTDASKFLGRVRRLVGKQGGMLIGVDLKKDPALLDAAYNDANGITESFNLNILNHLNEKFEADFVVSEFQHLAEYEADNGCVAMYLRSVVNQEVDMAGTRIKFTAGERIHTENSHKYFVDEFVDMAREAGFNEHKLWTDENNWFGVFYLY